MSDPLPPDPAPAGTPPGDRRSSEPTTVTDPNHLFAAAPTGDAFTTRTSVGGADPPPVYPRTVRVPGYEILAELGRGGMGIVFKARHVALNRVVALKMILAGAHASPKDRDRFRREAEAVARLKHSNIVQVYEVGEADGCPFLALEFVGGGNLDELLDGTPQPPAAVARVIETLARAVHAAHRAGIVHRDIKPHNVLLDRSKHGAESGFRPASLRFGASFGVKLTDFGVAKVIDQPLSAVSQTGLICGTPSYMAPEQAAGHGHDVGPAADVWALGAILYELLTGKPPFRADSVAETLDRVRYREPTPPSAVADVPADLEKVCLKCLQKDPRRRYLSAAELADDLQRFLNHKPVVARNPGAASRLGDWLRHPDRVRDAGTLAVVLASAQLLWVASAAAALPLLAARAATAVPLLAAGLATLRGHRLGVWVGLGAAAADLALVLAGAFLGELDELFPHPAGRLAALMLPAILAASVLATYGVAAHARYAMKKP